MRGITSPLRGFGRGGPFGSSGSSLFIEYQPISFDVADQPYTVTGISVGDTADDGSGIYVLTPAITDGHFTGGGHPTFTGLTFTLNDGYQDAIATLEGTIAAINSEFLDGLILDGMSAGEYTFEIPFGASTGGSTVSVLINVTVTDIALENALWYGSEETGTLTYHDEYVTIGI